MKRKIFLVLLIVSMIACLFAISVSAVDIDGIDYSFSGTSATITSANKTYAKENVVIPAKVDGHPVVSIAEEAFKGNDVMQTLTIQGNVVIETSAFENCTSLKEVIIKGVSTIEDRAFAGCSSLDKVVIEDKISYNTRRF